MLQQLHPGEKLKILRLSKGYTQKQLAQQLGINPKNARTVISLHESGKNGLKNRKELLGRIFDVTPSTFIQTSVLIEFITEMNLDQRILKILSLSWNRLEMTLINHIFSTLLDKK